MIDDLGQPFVARLHGLREVLLLHEIGSEKHERVGRSGNVALGLSPSGRVVLVSEALLSFRQMEKAKP